MPSDDPLTFPSDHGTFGERGEMKPLFMYSDHVSPVCACPFGTRFTGEKLGRLASAPISSSEAGLTSMLRPNVHVGSIKISGASLK